MSGARLPDPARSSEPLVLDTFEPEALPRGRALALEVALMSDELGRPLRLPMLALRGREDGPTLGLTAALHGDEVNGIRAIHRLFESIPPGELRGTVAALLVANLPGYREHRRRLGEGVDLNHVMPGSPDGNASQLYAHRLLTRIVERFDLLLDLHTASQGRENTLYLRADLAEPRVARMAGLMGAQIVLHNPPSPTTLRGAFASGGRPALTVEIGDPRRYQPELVDATAAGLRRVLVDAGLLPGPVEIGSVAPPIVCTRSRWLYADEGGLLEVLPPLGARVRTGEPVAELRDVYGRVLRRYESPEDGVVIGRSVNPVGRAGARILHLGIEGAPPDPGFRAGSDSGSDIGADIEPPPEEA